MSPDPLLQASGPPLGEKKPDLPIPSRRSKSWFASLFGARNRGEIAVYHHSNLFYWWPVWLTGYVCCLITYFGDYHSIIVPDGTIAAPGRSVLVTDAAENMETRDVLILPAGAKLLEQKNPEGVSEIVQPTIYMTRYRIVGTIYVIVLLLVISITNITVRGLWSVLVLTSLFMLTIIIMLAGWWGTIFRGITQFSMFINLGAYFVISSVLLILWLINFFLFDRQTYMVFTPGQLRVKLEIGGGETVYDTAGMVVQKQRTDIFRHWILGFGSGDLHVRPMGLGHHLDMPNVLNVGQVAKEIEQLVKEKMVVRGPSEGA